MDAPGGHGEPPGGRRRATDGADPVLGAPRGRVAVRSDAVGHAAHFLRRLDRVSDAHVELALALYRDEALLKEVLSRAELPELAERLAISLADPVDGPFVIVTREGRFVTCLGAGMRVGEMPVITRERLDTAAGRVQRMRDELDRVRQLSESGAEGKASLAFTRMQQQGPRFAREDAETLLRMQPLIEVDCIDKLLVLHQATLEATPSVAHYRFDAPRRLKSAQQERLLAFGDAVWSLSHLLVLVSSSRTHAALRRIDDERGPDDPTVFYWLAKTTFEWGTGLHFSRSLWFLAQGGKRALSAAKGHPSCITLSERLFRELGLCVLALRSDKLRAEASKAIVTRAREEKAEWDRAAARVTATFATLLRRVVSHPAEFEAHYLALSRIYAAAMMNDVDEPTEAQVAAVPDDVARLARMTLPVSIHDSNHLEAYAHAAQGLTAIVHCAPEELFLPTAWAQRLLPPRGVEEVAIWLPHYLKARLYTPRRKTHKAEPKAGRNDPCPCGSGQKYKRCCGASAK